MGACGVALAKAYSGHGGHDEAQEALSLAHRSGNPSALAMAFYSDGEVRGDEELEVALESLRRARAVDVGPVKSLSHLVSLTATAALLGRRGPLTPDTFDSVASTVRHWKDHGSTAFLVTCLRNTVPLLVRAGCDREALLLGDALSRIPTEHVSYGAEAEWLQQSLTLAEGRASTTAAHGSEGWMRLSDAAEEVVQTLRRLARESGAHPR